MSELEIIAEMERLIKLLPDDNINRFYSEQLRLTLENFRIFCKKEKANV